MYRLPQRRNIVISTATNTRNDSMEDTGWIDRAEYPFAPHFLHVGAHRMHYVDEERGAPVVMVHGTPSWSFLYRHLIKQLSPDYRSIAPDNIGFGLSERPSPYTLRIP